uniref:RING-type E3 ubiquitin transferase n=1 Tax=Chenopodium quinoa TaxID=63459 RepID=A0A803KZC6_CHEQI
MGGCCCSSRKTQLQGTPVYYYCPPSLEEQDNLRAYRGAAPGLSTGLLTPIRSLGCQGPKCDATKQSKPTSLGEIAAIDRSEKLTPGDHVGKSEGKTLADILLASPTKSDVEITKSSEAYELAIEEEDACPICLEEYDTDNPKMVTNCEHDFHLSCLLEWMERSDSCPVCDKEMIFDHPDGQN